jgi:1,4-dihydroxy-6-naphthoate synthase
MPITLTLAHSPDPDDVFMWWPITGMIEPPADPQRVEPARVVSPPEIDTGPFRFVPIAADIAALNRRAVAGSPETDLDITALSIFAWAHVHARYALTAFGSSTGYGYGPKVVARAAPPGPSASPACYAGAISPRDAGVRALLEPGALTAIPGRQTTAFLLLSMMLGDDAPRLRTLEMAFNRILDAVSNGACGVTHGLLIHQSQLTFAQLGLDLVADVGEWWLARTGLPLPLGGNAVRRDLDARHGPGTTQAVVDVLDRSLRHAVEHRERSLEYCMRFAPEITRAQAERYIEMYVSDLTVDAGEPGRGAMQRLLDEAADRGLGPPVGTVELLRATPR